ncbi:4'-phosphopantetheinyl transferase family protein [Roseateles flavus]|uniref:4'-phosphopantetheinyl transferase superfamily protein n=1 Tax=Roseateles flavus TaxID=3149041 RepID=A0ABV0GDS6_9BURK
MLDVWYSLAPPDGPPLLDAEEQARHARFLCQRTARTFAQAHTLKRCLLSQHHPQQAPLGWRFESGHAGKPALKAPAPCHFNLSHSGDAIAVAVADQPVGLDIESHRELKDGLAIAQRVFHPRERQWLLAQADFAAAFYRLWTLKEALLKATGEGFTQAPEALCWDELDAAMPAIHHAGQHWHALGLALPGSTLAVVMSDAQVLRNATLHELQSRAGAQLQGRPRCFPQP